MDKAIVTIKLYSRNNYKYYNKLIEIALKKGIDFTVFSKNYGGFEGYVDKENNPTSRTIIIDMNQERTDSTLGFDVGIFDSDYYSYSSIFQELIFSPKSNFPSFFMQLNNNWLFSDYETACDYLEYHRKLHAKGIDLEHEENMHVYRISRSVNIFHNRGKGTGKIDD